MTSLPMVAWRSHIFVAEKKKIENASKMVNWADITDPLELPKEMTHQLLSEAEKKEIRTDVWRSHYKEVS